MLRWISIRLVVPIKKIFLQNNAFFFPECTLIITVVLVSSCKENLILPKQVLVMLNCYYLRVMLTSPGSLSLPSKAGKIAK